EVRHGAARVSAQASGKPWPQRLTSTERRRLSRQASEPRRPISAPVAADHPLIRKTNFPASAVKCPGDEATYANSRPGPGGAVPVVGHDNIRPGRDAESCRCRYSIHMRI